MLFTDTLTTGNNSSISISKATQPSWAAKRVSKSFEEQGANLMTPTAVDRFGWNLRSRIGSSIL